MPVLLTDCGGNDTHGYWHCIGLQKPFLNCHDSVYHYFRM